MKYVWTENWIDHIIRKAFENYDGREIVIWGKYEVSESIREGFKEKYGIDISFYVDSDLTQTDGKKTFSPEYLYGKSNQYYLIIPIAFYSSVKEKVIRGGISLFAIITIFAIVLCDRRRIIMKIHMETK